MARAKDPGLASAIRALISETGMLAVYVTPNARQTKLLLPAAGDEPVLAVRTTATPEDGKANTDVIKLVARALGIAPRDVTLVRGRTAQRKLLKVSNVETLPLRALTPAVRRA